MWSGAINAQEIPCGWNHQCQHHVQGGEFSKWDDLLWKHCQLGGRVGAYRYALPGLEGEATALNPPHLFHLVENQCQCKSDFWRADSCLLPGLWYLADPVWLLGRVEQGGTEVRPEEARLAQAGGWRGSRPSSQPAKPMLKLNVPIIDWFQVFA